MKIDAKQLAQEFLNENKDLIDTLFLSKSKKPSKIINKLQKPLVDKIHDSILSISGSHNKVKNTLSLISLERKKINVPQNKTEKQKKRILTKYLKTQQKYINKIEKLISTFQKHIDNSKELIDNLLLQLNKLE